MFTHSFAAGSFAPRRILLVVSLALLTLALGACCANQGTDPAPDVPPPCHVNLCNISQDTWQNHIEPRHCVGNCPPKSIFVAGYCGGLADAVTFCQNIMNSPTCAPTQQPNNRVAYTATLAANVGSDRNNACAQTMTGTVIYDTGTNAVVTQFPGTP